MSWGLPFIPSDRLGTKICEQGFNLAQTLSYIQEVQFKPLDHLHAGTV